MRTFSSLALGFVLLVGGFAALAASPPSKPGPGPETTGAAGAPPLSELVQQIMTADYAGDRAALDRLFVKAEGYLGHKAVESRVRYWRGFAKWRRSINGANETPTPTDLVSDLDLAVVELRRSGELDPSFVDARIGEMQCLGLILFFDHERAADATLVARLRALLAELKGSAADNPRYVWAWGMAYFSAPPERGGGPANVIAAYLKALEGVRHGAGKPTTALDPAWGEAELNVNLAYSYLNQPSPDLALAKKYVDQALAIVPDWHYARDILRPQIEAAEKKAQTGTPGSGRN